MRKEWRGFKGTKWTEEVNLRDFIQNNYTAYEGDESFLAEPTDATNVLWGRLQELQKEERAKGGVLDMETEIVSSMTAYGPAYIDESKKELEKVVGLQSRWLSRLALTTVTSHQRSCTRSSQNIARLTTRAYSMLTPRR